MLRRTVSSLGVLFVVACASACGSANSSAVAPDSVADDVVDFGPLEVAQPWSEVTSLQPGSMYVVLFRAVAEDAGACIEVVVSETASASPVRAIPNCKPAVSTTERVATVEQFGSPVEARGFSVAAGYLSDSVTDIRLVGASDASVKFSEDAWLAAWTENLGPITIEFETPEATHTCSFATDRSATVPELSLCDLPLR